MSLLDPRTWLSPPTPEQASKIMGYVQPEAPPYYMQVARTIGGMVYTVRQGVSAALGTLVAPGELAFNAGGNVLTTGAGAFYGVGKVFNKMRTKMSNIITGKKD